MRMPVTSHFNWTRRSGLITAPCRAVALGISNDVVLFLAPLCRRPGLRKPPVSEGCCLLLVNETLSTQPCFFPVARDRGKFMWGWDEEYGWGLGGWVGIGKEVGPFRLAGVYCRNRVGRPEWWLFGGTGGISGKEERYEECRYTNMEWLSYQLWTLSTNCSVTAGTLVVISGIRYNLSPSLETPLSGVTREGWWLVLSRVAASSMWTTAVLWPQPPNNSPWRHLPLQGDRWTGRPSASSTVSPQWHSSSRQLSPSPSLLILPLHQLYTGSLFRSPPCGFSSDSTPVGRVQDMHTSHPHDSLGAAPKRLRRPTLQSASQFNEVST